MANICLNLMFLDWHNHSRQVSVFLDSVLDIVIFSTKNLTVNNSNDFWNLVIKFLQITAKNIEHYAWQTNNVISNIECMCYQELQPLISGIEQSLLALVSTYYFLPTSHGCTLRKLVADSMVSLASSMQCLLRALDNKHEGQRWSDLNWLALFTKLALWWRFCCLVCT